MGRVGGRFGSTLIIEARVDSNMFCNLKDGRKHPSATIPGISDLSTMICNLS
jgi:hypothetical protein